MPGSRFPGPPFTSGAMSSPPLNLSRPTSFPSPLAGPFTTRGRRRLAQMIIQERQVEEGFRRVLKVSLAACSSRGIEP